MSQKTNPTQLQLSYGADLCELARIKRNLENDRRHCDAYNIGSKINNLHAEMEEAGVTLPAVMRDLAERGEWGTFLNKYAHLMA